MPHVPAPLRWHLIGHLQRNKVKFVDPFVLVHGMDSLRLVDALHAHGVSRGRPVPVLLQVNVSGEDTKGGVTEADVPALAPTLRARDGLLVQGVMTMAPYEAPDDVLRATFSGARRCRDALRDAGLPAAELSMGMSGDFEMAVEEGATMVRLGSILFGARTQ
jgi:pyridoxal phosphate enzyme (YggS family)